ncbi:MAG: CRISPR-associated protein Cas4, partial [Gammaproteobacteria bacterium]
MTTEHAEPVQRELALAIPELSGDLPLLPARMVNEYQYCPRLAYLEWVQGEWAESGDTVEGRFHHRRVDKPAGILPHPADVDAGERIHARSITLSSSRLGLIAKLDLVEGEGDAVTPVDYKRGKRPHVPRGAYDPERVQLCVQGMILEEHGYRCEAGILYFAASRERVRVELDEELRAMTLAAVNGLRLVAAGGRMPPPLQDSPKCPRCSLVGICLPDEVNFLKRGGANPRPLSVAHDTALPLYVQARGGSVRKRGETLEVFVDDNLVTTARLIDVSQVVLMGNIYLSTPTLHELMSRETPVTWHSYGGWFLGHTQGTGHKNVELRTAQYRGSFDERVCLALAKGFVRAKIQNCRTLMRRNWRGATPPDRVLAEIKRDAEQSARAGNLDALLGFEGSAA